MNKKRMISFLFFVILYNAHAHWYDKPFHKNTWDNISEKIQKKVINPTRSLSLNIEKDFAKALGLKMHMFHFTILNDTDIKMDIKLEKLDTLLLTSGATSLTATVITSLPKNLITETLEPEKINIFSTPDKTFCWKYAQASYKNNQGNEIKLSLKKNHIAQCKNLYAAITYKLDSAGNPLKDKQGNYILITKRGKNAKEFMKTFKLRKNLK